MRKAVRAIIIKDNKLLTMHRNKFGQAYYTLPGGGIDFGETAEETLKREVREETNLHVTNHRLVFVEEAGDPFGTQYVYLCEVSGDDMRLQEDSDEAKINQLGQNLYKPHWLPLEKLAKSTFLSDKLKDAILKAVREGFPDKPTTIEHANSRVH